MQKKNRILEIKCDVKHLCSFNICEEESKTKVNLLITACKKKSVTKAKSIIS
jgi:hypothetical protein